MVHTLPCWNKQRDSSYHWLIAPRKNSMKSLMENGYPKYFIRWQCNRCCYTPSDNQHQQSAVAVLPLYTRLSDSIKRTLQRDLGIKTVRSAWSLKHILSIPKDPLPVCCWRVELYTGFHGRIIESLVFDRLSQNWIDGSGMSTIGCDGGDTTFNALAEHCWSLYHRVA